MGDIDILKHLILSTIHVLDLGCTSEREVIIKKCKILCLKSHLEDINMFAFKVLTYKYNALKDMMIRDVRLSKQSRLGNIMNHMKTGWAQPGL